MLTLKTLREGVFLTVFGTALALIGALAPVLLLVCGLTITLIVAVTTNRHTAVHALVVLVAAAVSAGLFAGTFEAVMILVEFGALGLLYGLCFKNRVVYRKILAAGIFTALFLVGLNLAILFLVLGENPYELVAAGIAADVYPEVAEQAVHIVKVLIPGSFVAWAIVVAWAGFFLTAGILHRLSYLRGPVPEFHRWRLSWHLIWFLIAGLSMTLIGDYWAFVPLATAGKNILLVAFVGGLLSGLTLTVYFYRILTLPRWLKVLLLVAVVLNWPVTLVILALAGLLDSWSDCRAWYERRREKF